MREMRFYERVALVCARIPEGRVATYGQIAALCERPRSARLVGYALGRGCGENAHRVVNSRGCLSGAAAFGQAGLQRAMLEAEGVTVSPDETVALSLFQWQPEDAEEAALHAAFMERGI